MNNLVDSCGWLEYLANTENANFFAPAIENTKHLIFPTICINEVFKHILRHRTENDAIHAIALMQQGNVIDLNFSLAITAAKLSLNYKLATADSIILATAYVNKAIIWTQDEDFKNLEGVQFKAKRNINGA